MRRRRSTRSVIKLLAAAAVATASIVGLVRLSTPRRLPMLADRFTPMANAGADPLVVCLGHRAPLSRFFGEPDVPADSRDPLHILLHGTGPAEGWRTIVRDNKRATFYWTDGNEYKICKIEKTPAKYDEFHDDDLDCHGGFGKCGRDGLRLALPKFFGTVKMHLDPQNPPDPESTTLHLLARNNGCARIGVERMPKPEVIESAIEIRIAMGVIPPTGGQLCWHQGNPFVPITIKLAAPIGRRKIVDGLFLPPEPLWARVKGLPRNRPHRRLAVTSPGLPLDLCEDIEEIDTKVLTQPRREGMPGQLRDFLRTYKNEHRPGDDDDDDDEKELGAVAAVSDTFAGEWYSRDAGGTFVLAFTDDPKPHLEAIRRRRPPETGDLPIDVVRAPHTESELKAAQKKVSKMFKQLRGRPNLKSYAYYFTFQRSRVEISLSGYTFEDMAAMASALDDDAHGKVCLWGRPQIRVPTLEDRLKARFAPMADAGADPLVVCLGHRAPMSKFFGHPDVPAGSRDTLHVRLPRVRCPRLEALPRDSPECPDELDLPNCDMLPNPKVGDFCEGDGECGTDIDENNCRNKFHSSADIYKIISLESDADHHQAAGPAEGWRTIKRGDKRATFYWTNGNKYKVCSYEKTRVGWDLTMNSCRGGSGKCGRDGLRLALPSGLGTVEMRLDRTNPPDSDSTTLHLLVRQNGCGSGRSGVERMPKPEVIESAAEIRIAMGVIPPDGAALCPGHPLDPITIKLAAPIGQRKIVDGLFLPPRPLWPKSLRTPRPYRRDLMIHALAFALAVLAMAMAAMAVRRWRRANAEVRRWRRARDHAS